MSREWPAALRVPLALAVAVALVGCEREERRFSEVPPGATANDAVVMSDLAAGPAPKTSPMKGPYSENAWAVAEGKALYVAYNCNGCHANGGGDVGPPLMDDRWIYGSEPENVFATIVEGRPNGMPSFRGKIPTDHVWRLVAYVRSMSGLIRQDARPGRNDDLAAKPPEQMEETRRPTRSFLPPSAQGTQ